MSGPTALNRIKVTRILISCLSLLLPIVLGISQGFADDSERIEKLEREVQELKAVVNQLVEENKSLKASQAQTQAIVAAPAPVMPEKPAAPLLNLRGFGDIQYGFSSVNRNDSTESDTNNFALGDMDLFITSRVSDKSSFLSETLFEFSSNSESSVEVERLSLKYELADWLNLSIGRGHTAVSYWNQYYHHGKWLYTTTDRPVTQRWDDGGDGILPTHFVGIEANGFVDVPGGTLSYVSELGNGRSTVRNNVQTVIDRNDSKMGNLYLTYEPGAIEGLGVGGSFLHDTIPADPGTANRGNEIDEDIYGTHLTYILTPYEFIAETSIVDHYNHATNLRDVTTGGYVQIAYTVNKYKPYFRYDWLWLDNADPFFTGIQDEVGYTTGLRYELSAYNALKLEYRYVNKDDEYKNEFTVQSSFAF